MMMMSFFMNQAARQFEQMWNQPAGLTPQQTAAEQARIAEEQLRRQQQLQQARERIANVFRQTLERSELDMKDSLAGVFDVTASKRSTAFFGIEGNPNASSQPAAADSPPYSDASVVDLRDLPPGLKVGRDYASGRLPFRAVNPGPAEAVLLDAGAVSPIGSSFRALQPDPATEGGIVFGSAKAPTKPSVLSKTTTHAPDQLSFPPKAASFWQRLKDGKYVGTGMGEESAQWYADKYVATGRWYYGAGGLMASLWTPDTYLQTLNTLVAGQAIGSTLGRLGYLGRAGTRQAADALVATAERESLLAELGNAYRNRRPADTYYDFPSLYRGSKPEIPKWLFRENPYRQVSPTTWSWMDAEAVMIRRTPALDEELRWVLSGTGR